MLVVRPLTPARLRLLPGWETGVTLAVMVLGVLALGQALESLTIVIGLGDSPTLVLIRRLLEGTAGPDLFGAVVVLGLIASTAEEIFFRGYMQSRLREHWSPRAAVVTTSAAFGVLHFDPSLVHIVFAFALGLYLGYIVEATGSALPAIACHIVNNVLYTLQTALGITLQGRRAHSDRRADRGRGVRGLRVVGASGGPLRAAPAARVSGAGSLAAPTWPAVPYRHLHMILAES